MIKVTHGQNQTRPLPPCPIGLRVRNLSASAIIALNRTNPLGDQHGACIGIRKIDFVDIVYTCKNKARELR